MLHFRQNCLMRIWIYYVYILTNYHHTVFYTGVTNNLSRRVYEHKKKINKGFTSKYNVDMLVYYEVFENIHSAIFREKQVKRLTKKVKTELVNSKNEKWEDLYNEGIIKRV